jgi:hypothetical protein
MISTDYKVIFLVLLLILGLLMNNVNSLQKCSDVCEFDDNVYTGHCGAFANDNDNWCTDSFSNEDYCCASSSSGCCDPNAGAIAGLVIGIVIILGFSIWGCYICCCKKKSRPSMNPNNNNNNNSNYNNNANPMNRNNIPSNSNYEMFSVTVPHGISSGMKFKISANGEELEVVCPPGAVAGQNINVEVPKPINTDQKFMVVIPNGVSPGMKFKVNANGQEYEVICPDGTGPGQSIEISIAGQIHIPTATPM